MFLALFGIGNDTVNLVVNLLVLSLVVLYIALVVWTYFDARRRIKDPVLIASSVGASLIPFIGTIVYSILRPPEFLADAHERQLEIRAAELRVKQLTEQSCPRCEFPVEKSFLRCPNCRARLKDPCRSCGKPVDPRWALCPYCEAPVHKPVGERRAPTREPRRAAAAAPSRGTSPQPKRPAEAQRLKGPPPGQRRAPARSGSPATGRPAQNKPEAATRPAGGATGEERPRPATAS